MLYYFIVGAFVLGSCFLLLYFAQRGNLGHRRGFGRKPTQLNDAEYDADGFDREGYNRHGYNRKGKNRRGQYNRLYDTFSCEEEGFCDLGHSSVALSSHSVCRFRERMGITERRKMEQLAFEAFRFGKSKRQIKKSSAYWIDEMERKHDNGIVLIYHNYIYIFTCDRVLVTLFYNDRVEL